MFRRPGGANNRLAAWDPFDKTMRYFKFLLYTAAERQPERSLRFIARSGRWILGSPLPLRFTLVK